MTKTKYKVGQKVKGALGTKIRIITKITPTKIYWKDKNNKGVCLHETFRKWLTR